MVPMKRAPLIPIFAALIIGGEAYAQDTASPETCFSIEKARDSFSAAKLKPERRDTIDSFLEAHFFEIEKRSLPMQLYIKHKGTRDDFIVSESGEVKAFHSKVFAAPKEALICGLAREDGKIGIGRSTSVRFKNQSGTHTMAEISDGVKDGKSHYKKSVGGAAAIFVPKMTHIAITYDTPDATPNVSAIANGESRPVPLEPYGDMWVIDVDALKDIEAETIHIGGGAYELYPVPSIKKMESLGIK